MTDEEAIREISWVKDYGFKPDRMIVGTDKILEAFYKAIEALEKQIPMKPILTTHTRRCGRCGRQLSAITNKHPRKKYCESCSQAIDWSEE